MTYTISYHRGSSIIDPNLSEILRRDVMNDFDIEEEALEDCSEVDDASSEESDKDDEEFDPKDSSGVKSNNRTEKSKSRNPLAFSSSDYLADSFKIPAPVIAKNSSITRPTLNHSMSLSRSCSVRNSSIKRPTINHSMSSLRLSESESSRRKSRQLEPASKLSSSKNKTVSKPLKRLSVSHRDVPVAESSLLSTSRLSRTINVPGSDKTIFKCDICCSVFSNKSGFTRHKCQNTSKSNISMRSDSAIMKCNQCDKVCLSVVGLKRHKTLKHNEKASSIVEPPAEKSIPTEAHVNEDGTKGSNKETVSQNTRVKKTTRTKKGK